jgi:hypothetical protein
LDTERAGHLGVTALLFVIGKLPGWDVFTHYLTSAN